MKTFLPLRTILFNLSLVFIYLLPGNAVNAQSYTTIANGLWSSAATWQGGIIPNATNIPLTAVINIKHVVTYSGANISNYGTININNQQGVSPRLFVAASVTITNNTGGKINIINAEYRQYRFIGGLETGVAQSGAFMNNGGCVQVSNSFVEVAQDWSNENKGIVVFRNSSLVIGRNYEIKNLGIDTIENTSVSIGMQGSGDYRADGTATHFQAVRFQLASSAGRFELKSGIANGSIDYILMKNHVTNTYSSDKIEAGSNLVVTKGLTLKAYCIANSSNYRPNGKISGTQTPDCSLNYFPAGLMGSTSTASFNYSAVPKLISGTALQVGAIYKYEGVTPGIDAIVKIDSLAGGATITKIDDNAGGLGYIEGFQPEIKAGPTAGKSYGVFTIDYRVTGTSTSHKMNTLGITALDIDGTAALKEFDQIDLGPGATAAYKASPTNISLTQVGPGAFQAINADGKDNNGIDTVSMANMFTVTNTNVSSFTLKLGVVKTNAAQPARQFGIYMKGFVYPSLVTLPVKLISFTAVLNDNNKVDLRWSTASEINVSHFMIERSIDGANYSDAGLVFAYGNTTSKSDYVLADNISKIKSNVVYYRLRSVDIDGKNELSQVRTIRIGKKNEQMRSIPAYPNPASSELLFTIPANWQGKKVSYELFNNQGQVVKRTITAYSSQTETINVSSLAPGMYVAKVTSNGETAQQIIIKE